MIFVVMSTTLVVINYIDTENEFRIESRATRWRAELLKASKTPSIRIRDPGISCVPSAQCFSPAVAQTFSQMDTNESCCVLARSRYLHHVSLEMREVGRSELSFFIRTLCWLLLGTGGYFRLSYGLCMISSVLQSPYFRSRERKTQN